MRPEWIKDTHMEIMESLERSGFSAYFVGGCVRDHVMNFGTPKDVDISTNATAEQVKECLDSRFRMADTGIAHGTITVTRKNVSVEVTTFRRDVATDGRRAVVEYAKTMEEDAQRRDFTINALYMDKNFVVHDPTNQGIRDANNNILRFVGDADTRCKEDYLRILRFYRFYAAKGLIMNTDSADAAIRNSPGLVNISKERIWSELKKILEANGLGIIEYMSHNGVLKNIFNGSSVKVDKVCIKNAVETVDRFRSITGRTGNVAWWVLYATVFPKMPGKKFLPFTCANEEQAKVTGFYNDVNSDETLKSICFRTQSVTYTDYVSAARGYRDRDGYEKAIGKVLPVGGDFYLKRGFKNAEIGAQLNKARQDFVSSGYTMTEKDF